MEIAGDNGNAPAHSLRQTFRELERAYADFFQKRADSPRSKKGQRDSFRYPDQKQIKLEQGNKRLFLPEPGCLRYRDSRDVSDAVKQVVRWNLVCVDSGRTGNRAAHPQ